MAIEVGQEAPDFTLKGTDGEDVALSSFRGEKNVVLVFYPAAFSGVCTKQLTQINEHDGRYVEGDAQVIGVSVDNHHAQAAFARELGLDGPMLVADFEPKGEVSRAYGVYLDAAGLANRATFVIDKAGVVRGAQVADVPTDMVDEDEYFRILAVCSP